jgi:hypothetical protein
LFSEEDACLCSVWCLIADNRELADEVSGIYQQLKAEEYGGGSVKYEMEFERITRRKA